MLKYQVVLQLLNQNFPDDIVEKIYNEYIELYKPMIQAYNTILVCSIFREIDHKFKDNDEEGGIQYIGEYGVYDNFRDMFYEWNAD